MNYNRAALKRQVRQAMRSQRPHPMLITLLFTVIVNGGTQIINQILGFASGFNTLSNLYYQALLDYEDPLYAIQYVLLSTSPLQLALALFAGVFISGIITFLWSSLMRTGYAGFCLDMARGRQPKTGTLFRAFPLWPGVLFTQFLAGLFRSLWAVLLGVGLGVIVMIAALLFVRLEVLLVPILLAAYTAFFLGYTWITLRYALVDYLIADQDLTGMDAIRESKRLMRGNTGRLFTMELSFIGWYLLEAAVILATLIPALMAFGAIGSDASDHPGIPTIMIVWLMIFISCILMALIASVGISILNLWLTPYITGAEALFYDWARGANSATGSTGGYGYGLYGGWDRPQSPPPPEVNRDDPWD